MRCTRLAGVSQLGAGDLQRTLQNFRLRCLLSSLAICCYIVLLLCYFSEYK